MLRLFLSFQACLLAAALAQPIDARDSLVYPTNPPKPVSPQQSSASSLPAKKPTAPPAPSVLKFGELDIVEAANGQKELKATLIHAGSEQLNPADTRLVVFFYDADAAGNITLSNSKIETNWDSPPVDWSEKGNGEAITIRYPAPPADSGKKYAGYILGIYYQDQLQDSRASSPDLLQKFPLQATW